MKLYMKSVKGHRYTEATSSAILTAASEVLYSQGLSEQAAMLMGMALMCDAHDRNSTVMEIYQDLTNLEVHNATKE